MSKEKFVIPCPNCKESAEVFVLFRGTGRRSERKIRCDKCRCQTAWMQNWESCQSAWTQGIVIPAGVGQYATELGRKGGLIGGVKRREKIDAIKRSQIAKTAAKTRWARTNKSRLTIDKERSVDEDAIMRISNVRSQHDQA